MGGSAPRSPIHTMTDDPAKLPSDTQVYSELRRIAASQLRRERRRGTLMDTTVLVHEAWVRLSSPHTPQRWDNRAHFYASAALAMRRILVEQARRNLRRARTDRLGPRAADIPADPNRPEPAELIALDDALTELERRDPRAASIVSLRFFAGLDMPTVAELSGLSLRTAEREWAHARAWLQQRIDHPDTPPDRSNNTNPPPAP